MAPDKNDWLYHQNLVLKGLEVSEKNDEKLAERCSNLERRCDVLCWQVRAMWFLMGGVIVKVLHQWIANGGPH